MQVNISLDQEALIRRAIISGRYRNIVDAVNDAMARWEQDEWARIEILASLDEAEADLRAGRYSDYADSDLPGLARELKRAARKDRERRR